MLTITAVTISGGTRTLSSVTNVPPTVWRVLVSQLGSSGPSGPMWRAIRPRATPTTRARRTCAANGTRRRRASTRAVPFGGCARGTAERRGSTGRGRHPAEIQRTAARQAPQVLHTKVNAARPLTHPACGDTHGDGLLAEPPAGRAAGEVAVGERDDRDRPDGVGAVD